MSGKSSKYHVGPSHIHGNGIIASKHIYDNSIIGCAIEVNRKHGPQGDILSYLITEHLGKWLNHSKTPSAVLKEATGGFYILTTRYLKEGEEITVNYNHTPDFIKAAGANFIK